MALESATSDKASVKPRSVIMPSTLERDRKRALITFDVPLDITAGEKLRTVIE